jgi:hypothetical protein
MVKGSFWNAKLKEEATPKKTMSRFGIQKDLWIYQKQAGENLVSPPYRFGLLKKSAEYDYK